MYILLYVPKHPPSTWLVWAGRMKGRTVIRAQSFRSRFMWNLCSPKSTRMWISANSTGSCFNRWLSMDPLNMTVLLQQDSDTSPSAATHLSSYRSCRNSVAVNANVSWTQPITWQLFSKQTCLFKYIHSINECVSWSRPSNTAFNRA